MKVATFVDVLEFLKDLDPCPLLQIVSSLINVRPWEKFALCLPRFVAVYFGPDYYVSDLNVF